MEHTHLRSSRGTRWRCRLDVGPVGRPLHGAHAGEVAAHKQQGLPHDRTDHGGDGVLRLGSGQWETLKIRVGCPSCLLSLVAVGVQPGTSDAKCEFTKAAEAAGTNYVRPARHAPCSPLDAGCQASIARRERCHSALVAWCASERIAQESCTRSAASRGAGSMAPWGRKMEAHHPFSPRAILLYNVRSQFPHRLALLQRESLLRFENATILQIV